MLQPVANKHFQILVNGCLVVAFLTLNSALNLTNKWALGIYGFRFPLMLTTCHMGFSFFCLLPFMLHKPYLGSHQKILKKQWKGLLAIGLYMAANISMNNISLVSISLSLNQVIRSSMPVCAAILAISIEQTVPSKAEALSLLVLTSGVMMAVKEGSVSGSVSGFALCIAGTVSNAAMVCTSGRLLSEKLDVLLLTFYTAPVSCFALLPGCILREGKTFVEFASHRPRGVLLVLACSSVMALLYNVVHALMIKKTSAVAVTVLGEIKVLGLLLLSAVFLDEGRLFTRQMMVGAFLAMVGFSLYSHTKVVKYQQQEAGIATKQCDHTVAIKFGEASQKENSSGFCRQQLTDGP